MARNARDPETVLLLDLLAEAYERKSWHGTNLRGSFRGMTAAPRAKALHLVRGVAAHDLYHAGQVQVLKKLRPGG